MTTGALPPSLSKIALAHKPTAQLAYHYSALAAQTSLPAQFSNVAPRLVVFINGMVAPQLAWHPVIKLLQEETGHNPSRPFGFLTYDRYGQGPFSDPDPEVIDPTFGHDLNVVVKDLNALIDGISKGKSLSTNTDTPPELVLVGNSIGCAVARHYAATYPRRVAGILLLDSVLANSDFHNDVFPDPDSANFDPSALPSGYTIDDLKTARDLTFKIFSPTLPNKEGFDRRNMRDILPAADSPKLIGVDGKAPYLTVVGHDIEKFAKESTERMGITDATTRFYVQPYWEKYNEGLLSLSDREPEKNVKIAPGCGHFVQVDNPQFAANELSGLLTKAGWW